MTPITTDNYFSTINQVDLTAAPEAIRNGHGLFVRATNEGKNMQAYQANETIKRVVDTYIEKLNAWASGQQKPKDDNRILIVRPGASHSDDAAKKAAEADMKKDTPAEKKKKKLHATQSKRKTGRKAKPKMKKR